MGVSRIVTITTIIFIQYLIFKYYFGVLAYRNGWLICTASKSFAVYAATATEKAEWIAHINKCVEDLLRKSESY